MKVTSILVGAFAALATAAPTEKVERGSFNDFNSINNFQFANQDLGYLGVINSLDIALLTQLGQVNGFNFGQFNNLFLGNQFDVNSILQVQSLLLLQQFGQLGVLGGFDLSSLVLNPFNFGLINNVGSFNAGSLIDQALVPQLQQVIASGGVATGVPVAGQVQEGVSPAPRPESIVTAEQEKAQDGASSLAAEAAK